MGNLPNELKVKGFTFPFRVVKSLSESSLAAHTNFVFALISRQAKSNVRPKQIRARLLIGFPAQGVASPRVLIDPLPLSPNHFRRWLSFLGEA